MGVRGASGGGLVYIAAGIRQICLSLELFMKSLLVFAIIVGVWYLLQAVILPRMGIST